MAEKFKGFVALKALIERDGKILLVENARDLKWQLPGGRMDTGESPEETLQREIREELSIETKPVSVFSAGTFKNSKGEEHLYLVYRCEFAGNKDDIQIDEKEVKSFRWIDKKKLDSLDIWPEYLFVIRKALS